MYRPDNPDIQHFHGLPAGLSQADIDAARVDWARGSGRMLWLLMGGGLFAVIVLVTTLIMSLLGGMPNWVGHIVMLLIVGVPLIQFTVGWRMTASALVGMCYGEIAVDCPHCAHKVDVKKPWQCGWCNGVSNTNMLVSPHLILDGCSHMGHHAPAAIRCPHCQNDIIRDAEVYADRQAADPREPDGVADFRIRNRRLLPGDAYVSLFSSRRRSV